MLTTVASSASWITDGLSGIVPFITKGFELVTMEPMCYYVALGLLGAAIGIFYKAKHAAH